MKEKPSKEERNQDTNRLTDKPTQHEKLRPNTVTIAGKPILAPKPPSKKKANKKLSQASQLNKIDTYFKRGTGTKENGAKGLGDTEINTLSHTRPRKGPKGQDELDRNKRPETRPQEE